MKISLDEVEDAIMQANIGEKANIIIDDLKARIKELEEEREAKKAANGLTTPDCRTQCSACGANKLGGKRRCCR